MSHAAHILKHTAEEVHKMKPLKDEKNPIIAGVVGFLFGPLGIGLYFQSWKDFFVCLGVLLVLTIFTGIGIVPGWLFSAGYGIYRAITSNDANGF